jgi:hypothetical protein
MDTLPLEIVDLQLRVLTNWELLPCKLVCHAWHNLAVSIIRERIAHFLGVMSKDEKETWAQALRNRKIRPLIEAPPSSASIKQLPPVEQGQVVESWGRTYYIGFLKDAVTAFDLDTEALNPVSYYTLPQVFHARFLPKSSGPAPSFTVVKALSITPGDGASCFWITLNVAARKSASEQQFTIGSVDKGVITWVKEPELSGHRACRGTDLDLVAQPTRYENELIGPSALRLLASRNDVTLLRDLVAIAWSPATTCDYVLRNQCLISGRVAMVVKCSLQGTTVVTVPSSIPANRELCVERLFHRCVKLTPLIPRLAVFLKAEADTHTLIQLRLTYEEKLEVKDGPTVPAWMERVKAITESGLWVSPIEPPLYSEAGDTALPGAAPETPPSNCLMM